MVKKRKKRIKDTHKKNGLAKIANLTSKSFGSVLSNYKKNKELEKIKTNQQIRSYRYVFLKKLGLDSKFTSRDLKNRIPRRKLPI